MVRDSKGAAQGCAFSYPTLYTTLLGVLTLVAFGLYWWHTHCEGGRTPLTSHREFVGEPGDGTVSAASLYPSGPWRGYYKQGNREHGVVEFTLNFSADGSVTGEGRDDVGAYRISGRHREGRVAFTKSYEAGSRSAAGHVSAANLGHDVEYRGGAARLLEDRSPSVRGGVKGTWSITHSRGKSQGGWHLWPVMAGWGVHQATGGRHDGGGGTDGDGGGAGDDESHDESECCVCYDNPIDTCLQPCGHVALCSSCAHRLRQRRCPLCRAEILDMVLVTSRDAAPRPA
jgi:hypothetical protein